MIRKRLVLFFELEVEKKIDEIFGGKRRVVVVVLFEKMFRKINDILFFISIVLSKVK